MPTLENTICHSLRTCDDCYPRSFLYYPRGKRFPAVKLVMALLLLVSAMSWTYIFHKMFAIKNAQTQTEGFERAFWSGGNLNALYEEATSNRRRGTGNSGALERIFEAGMGEFHKAK